MTDDNSSDLSAGHGLPRRYFNCALEPWIVLTTVNEISAKPSPCSFSGVVLFLIARQAAEPPGQLKPNCGTSERHTFK